MDLELIQDTISQLEHLEPTYETCQKLASLYIVKEYYKPPVISRLSQVEDELLDILPRYKDYIEVKKEYQLERLSKDKVLLELNKLCEEIYQFIDTLYKCSDMEEERNIIINMTHNISNNISK